MNDAEPTYWKKCSTCKSEIPFSTMYYVCSVSTCQHKRKGFRFCKVSCWSEHLGMMNHRDAWAREARSPSRAEYLNSEEGTQSGSSGRAPKRTIVEPKKKSSGPSGGSSRARKEVPFEARKIHTETLVVVSKVKKLIKEQSDFNTSQCAIDRLTEKVVEECLKGIEAAKEDGRKTVMGRDIH